MVRAASLASVKDNYSVLQELWDEALDVASDSDTRLCLNYWSPAYYDNIWVLFWSSFRWVYSQAHWQLKTIQSPSLSASDSQEIAELTCKILASIRNDEAFDLFWANVLLQQNHMGINEPALPRKRKVPARLEVGTSASNYIH